MVFDQVLTEVDKFNGNKINFHRNCIRFHYSDRVVKYDTSKLTNTECAVIIREINKKSNLKRKICS